ncbi:M42 family metallopeptidase [Candidatus Avelusimicrobium stercoris]|uniref:M42 family metallopeptidase n=1 Tax=Candidatus Avelusimicrobium stercoris TaxID=1947924 RepID=UPI003D10CDEB
MDAKLDFSILKTLTELPGVSGRETAVREYLKNLLKDSADEIRTDALGNLIVFKKGSSNKNLLFCAHMDEVGLMIHFVDERGFLRFVTVGGIDPRTLLAQRVRVQTKSGALLGIIDTKPAHITTEADRGKALGVKELFIDLGLCAEEAKKRVEPGDWAVLDRSYEEFGDGKISAKALDNRAGVFVLAEVVRALKNPFYNVYAVFTVQEEVGLRGATTAAYGVNADVSLCLDTTGAADIPGCAPQDYICSLGGGVGLTALDARTITPENLFNELKQICDTHNIRRQVRVAPRGGNDAGAVHLSKTGVPTCGLSVPTRNIHSNVEIVSKQDLENTFRLAYWAAQNGLKA